MRDRQNHKYISKHKSKSGKIVYVYDRRKNNSRSNLMKTINYFKQNPSVLKSIGRKVFIGFNNHSIYNELNPISNTTHRTKEFIESGKDLFSKLDTDTNIIKVASK